VRRQVPWDTLHIFTNLSPEQLSSTCSSEQQLLKHAVVKSLSQGSSGTVLECFTDVLGDNASARYAIGRQYMWKCSTNQQ
jgi:hypothetical protein